MLKKTAIFSLILSFIFIIFYRDSERKCSSDEFKIGQMERCQPLLTCGDVKDLKLYELAGYGAVKAVYRALWKNVTVAVSFLQEEKYKPDFLHGVRMLKKYRNHPLFVKLIGECPEKNLMITEYHKNGNAVDIFNKLNRKRDGVQARLALCLNYAKILEVLHNKTTTVTVNCDSNDLNKTLSQLLISDDFNLLLNDVDSLAEVHDKYIKCGAKPIYGSFVPPEQKQNEKMKTKGYNEKTDIWKAASVCHYFLGDLPNAILVRYRLFDVHKKCKDEDPQKRPSARDLVTEYSRVLSELDGDWL